jgi:lysyl-tRNA synthetase class 2
VKLAQLFSLRSELYRAIRDFFSALGYVEVETPILVRSPGMEPNLDPFHMKVGKETWGLITSPEYAMKKLLGKGLEKIFTMSKVFRREAVEDDLHTQEFTMLEWYASGMEYQEGMGVTESLIKNVGGKLHAIFPEQVRDLSSLSFVRVRLPTRFKEQTGVTLCDASTEDLKALCQSFGLPTSLTDSWSDLFYRIYLVKIEPWLTKGAVFVYDYPKEQAALSRFTKDGRYAERFELYLNGMELCNAFTELTDVKEQRRRFLAEAEERQRLTKHVFPIDEELLRVLPSMREPTFGNALGLDRLLMFFLNAPSIHHVIPL